MQRLLGTSSSLSALLLLLTALPSVAADETRPNILWIIGEDVGPDMACYGRPEIWTPNVDRLAREGVRFTHAYTVTPVCSTSRSSFMTGMYAFTIGAHNHRSHRDDGHRLPDGVRVLTDWFRDAGYFTANVRHFPESAGIRGTGKTDWNFHYEGKPFDSDRWTDLKENQPFYAQVNFPETHRGGSWNTAHERIERTADPEKVPIPPYYPDHPITREVFAQYHNAIMALDQKVGVVLDQLERDGLLEDTIVVFMGDHGRAMVRGKQWPYETGLHIPLIIRWPEDLPAPDEFERGAVDSHLTESIDLSATALSWAGIEKPAKMQGRVFWGEQAEPRRALAFAGRDRGDETVDRIRTVRNDRYRYIRNFYPERPFLQLNRYKEFSYPILRLMRRLDATGQLDPVQARLTAPTRPREELYDLESDPHEIDNLADSPEHQDVLRDLRQQLNAWVERIDDQGRFPEPPEVVEHWERQMKQNYEEKLRRLNEREAAESGVPSAESGK